MNDEQLIWEAYANSNEEVDTLTLSDAVANGYDLFHCEQKQRNIKHSSFVVLFAYDLESIRHYGQYVYATKSKDLIHIPNWVKEWTDKHDIYHDYVKGLNPEKIVDSANAWDDSQFVSDFWNENEDRLMNENIFGFLTNDGAVVFDPSMAPIVRLVGMT